MALGGILERRNHEVAHAAALKFGGALEQGVQIGADSGFEAGCGKR
jgi:hypothetical protein